MTQAELRRKAATKFPQAGRMLFEREALEQASAALLAEHRAERLARHAPPGPLYDLGCGLGGDLLALARYRPVVGYERDPVRAALARANLAALGLDGTVHCQPFPPGLEGAGGLCDPARRRDGQRLFDPERLEPPLSSLRSLKLGLLAVKLAPGLESVPDGFGVEFVGLPGECREAVLWSDCPGERWGSFYRDGWHRVEAGPDPEPRGRLVPGCWLYDPEPVAVRARALGSLSTALQAYPFDPQVAYLVGAEPRDHPLAQRFQVLEVLEFSLKRVQSLLKALGWARLEIKKRAFAPSPEELRKKLRLPARGGEGTLLLTRCGLRPMAVMAQRV